MNFDQAFDRLIGHEGGYSNHSADPGGETMWGITKRTAQSYGYMGEMKKLPRETAKEIYRRLYWNAIKAESLPEPVRFDVFDGAVNSGVSQSAKWLQRAAGVQDDGVIGPKTIAAASVNSPSIAAKYNGHRLMFMTDLKTWKDFGRGWSRRIASNLIGASNG